MLTWGGCFSSKAKNIEAFAKPYQTNVTTDKYVLQPPDEIQVQSMRIPEINLQIQKIRPDGKISFEGLGEFEVAGKTPAEVAEMMRNKASELYTMTGGHPIDLHITIFQSKWFYVVGEVQTPGPKVYTGRDTLMTALAAANPQVTGWKQRVQVIRPSERKDVKPQVFEANYMRMIEHGDLRKDVLLQEGDIVYVPPTILSAIAMVIEEFVRPIGRALSPAVMVSSATN